MIKKLSLSACALFLAAASAGAQDAAAASGASVTTPAAAASTAHGPDPSVNTLTGGLALDYLTDGDFNGFGLNMGGKYWVLDGGYSSDSADGVSTSSWYVGIGGHYRYWFNKWLYCEGNLGLMYGHGKVEYEISISTRVKPFETDHPSTTTTEKHEESDGNLGLFLAPRLGVKLFTMKNGNAVSLVAGYRWNFNEFKFDKEHTADYFTIGIASVF